MPENEDSPQTSQDVPPVQAAPGMVQPAPSDPVVDASRSLDPVTPEQEPSGTQGSLVPTVSPMVELIDSRIPGFKGASRGSRWKIIILALALCMVTALAASYFQFGFNLLTMSANASAEEAANDEVDAKKPPFTMTVTMRTKVHEILSSAGTVLLFKEPFTRKEQEKLARLGKVDPTDPQASEKFIKKLLTSFHEKPSVMLSGGFIGSDPVDRMLHPLQLTLQSSRSGSVTIRDMNVTNLRCSQTTISAVIHLPPQGGGVVEGVTVDLVNAEADAPLMEIKGRKSHPYFSNKFVELGNGETSWAANLDVMAANQQCRWDLSVSYVDSGENKVRTLKSPLFRTDGYPDTPSQLFEFMPSPDSSFTSTCWGEKIDKSTKCDVRAGPNDHERANPELYYWAVPIVSP